MNSTLIFILGSIVGAIITSIVSIFFIPVKTWLSTKETGICAFKTEDIPYKGYEVTISKRFNKTTKVNCPWFDKRTTIQYEGNNYHVCPFGKKNNYGFAERKGVCPFA